MRMKCASCKIKPVARERSGHHLKPRYHINGRGGAKVPLCIGCHRSVHKLFTNEELYKEFNTVEKLVPELQHRLMQEGLSAWFHRDIKEAELESIQKKVHDWFDAVENGNVAQLAEHALGKGEVAGANPAVAFGTVVQEEEHGPCKSEVEGASPSCALGL